MQPESERELSGVAVEHHGVFTAAHAAAAGLTRSDVHRRLESGRLVAVHNGVYRHAGTPLSWRGEVLAACWAGGFRAAASHRSAARLWELPGGREDVVEIVCPRWRRAHHEHLVVHETKALGALDLAEVDRIPVTTAERTLLDLGAVYGPRTVELALEHALRRELATIGTLRGLLRRVGRSGRNGSGVLRALVDERDPDRAPTESAMETRVLQVLRANGLPEPVPQLDIFDPSGRFVARVDFAYVEWKIALEYESVQEHTGKLALLRDNPRRRRLVGLGWKPIGVTVEDVRNGGFRLCADIRAAARRPA